MDWRSCTQKCTSCEALRSFSIVLEVRVSSQIGVLRKTIQALVRHNDPRKFMEGSIVTGSTEAGVGVELSADGSGGIMAGAGGSSARMGPMRVTTTTPAQRVSMICRCSLRREESRIPEVCRLSRRIVTGGVSVCAECIIRLSEYHDAYEESRRKPPPQ